MTKFVLFQQPITTTTKLCTTNVGFDHTYDIFAKSGLFTQTFNCSHVANQKIIT